MELYKKTSLSDTSSTEFVIFPEPNVVRHIDEKPREWYNNQDHYEFLDYVKRGEKFYTYVCYGVQYESDVYWDYDECKAEMEKHARDYVEEYGEPAEMAVFTHKVMRCSGFDKEGVEIGWEDYKYEEE